MKRAEKRKRKKERKKEEKRVEERMMMKQKMTPKMLMRSEVLIRAEKEDQHEARMKRRRQMQVLAVRPLAPDNGATAMRRRPRLSRFRTSRLRDPRSEEYKKFTEPRAGESKSACGGCFGRIQVHGSL